MNSSNGKTRTLQISKGNLEAWIEQGMRQSSFLFNEDKLKISLEGPDMMTVRLVPVNQKDNREEEKVVIKSNGKTYEA